MRGYFVVSGWSSSVQSLVVQALAMRQLGRLNVSRLLAAGNTLTHTDWCPRSIHTRQLWGCSAAAALGCHRPALCSRDAVRSCSVHQLRFKSSKKKSSVRASQEEDTEEEDEAEDSDYEDAVNENSNEPKDYKDMEKYVQSFRYDVIMGAGLDIARNKIEDGFYNNKLRLNGQKLIKKSKAVKVGDTLDLILSENQDSVTLMRVVLRGVVGESSRTEKQKVSLRRWKFKELPREDVYKS